MGIPMRMHHMTINPNGRMHLLASAIRTFHLEGYEWIDVYKTRIVFTNDTDLYDHAVHYAPSRCLHGRIYFDAKMAKRIIRKLGLPIERGKSLRIRFTCAVPIEGGVQLFLASDPTLDMHTLTERYNNSSTPQ